MGVINTVALSFSGSYKADRLYILYERRVKAFKQEFDRYRSLVSPYDKVGNHSEAYRIFAENFQRINEKTANEISSYQHKHIGKNPVISKENTTNDQQDKGD